MRRVSAGVHVPPEFQPCGVFQLACTLPDKELMAQVVGALLEHISNPSHSYASLLPCVRTLVMLTEHDYGFYHLKVSVPRLAFIFFIF